MPGELAAPGSRAAPAGRCAAAGRSSSIRSACRRRSTSRSGWFSSPDGSLASLEQERWASPLRDEFQQAVLETLIVRYGVVELRRSADPATDAARALRLDIDVRRFESLPGQEARIQGSWTLASAATVAPARPASVRCEWLIREPAAGPLSALADAHRRAVRRLAQGIGAAIVAVGRGQPATCDAGDAAG